MLVMNLDFQVQNAWKRLYSVNPHARIAACLLHSGQRVGRMTLLLFFLFAFLLFRSMP